MTMKDYIEKVQAELVKKDCNAGEIKDATGLDYPQIFSAIKQLSDEDRVSYYFACTTAPSRHSLGER